MSVPCPWPSVCTCLHDGCVAGWIDKVDSSGKDVTAPCPKCRPEVSEHLRSARQTLAQARHGLRNVKRPSRERPATIF